jgi:hypothetical protein
MAKLTDQQHLDWLKQLERNIFASTSDMELMKSYWISLCAEEMGAAQRARGEEPESAELLEETASFEWFGNYEMEPVLDIREDDLYPELLSFVERIRSM